MGFFSAILRFLGLMSETAANSAPIFTDSKGATDKLTRAAAAGKLAADLADAGEAMIKEAKDAKDAK